MPQVLTTNASIVCPHGGVGVTTPSQPYWTVNGGFVCVEGDKGVLSCAFIPPCVSYILQSMKLNATEILGQRVMLVTDFNQGLTGLPLVMTEPIANTTFDNSTVAGLPDSGPAPPLPPSLQDMTAPDIQGAFVPPLSPAIFSQSTQTPATIAASFTLTTTFPKQWSLIRAGGDSPGTSEDLTNNTALLTTSGGVWSSSPLTISMNLTLPYLSSLATGTHTFYMTGVSQRGISNYATVLLEVTA